MQKSCEHYHGNCITEAFNTHKMLGLPYKQARLHVIHFEEISSHMYKGEVSLLIYLSYDVVLTRHVLQHTNKRERH